MPKPLADVTPTAVDAAGTTAGGQDQSFTWRHQTRAFTVEEPRAFTAYRLRVTDGTAATTALAEVDLLAR